MRLPGTVNLPDTRKQAKGRIPAPATLLWFEADRVYDLSQFTPAEADAPTEAGKKQSTAIDIANVPQRVSPSPVFKVGALL